MWCHRGVAGLTNSYKNGASLGSRFRIQPCTCFLHHAMLVTSEPEILSTRQELGVYLRRRVAPVDVNSDRSFSLEKPYSVPKSEPCAVTGMHSTATSRVTVLEAESDQTLLVRTINHGYHSHPIIPNIWHNTSSNIFAACVPLVCAFNSVTLLTL